MLIASEANMRTASKGGVALKTAPLSSGDNRRPAFCFHHNQT